MKENKVTPKEAKVNLVSIGEYAELCKVSKTAIYGRIERGVIVPEKVPYGKSEEAFAIDTIAYPPSILRRGKRPVSTKEINNLIKTGEIR